MSESMSHQGHPDDRRRAGGCPNCHDLRARLAEVERDRDAATQSAGVWQREYGSACAREDEASARLAEVEAERDQLREAAQGVGDAISRSGADLPFHPVLGAAIDRLRAALTRFHPDHSLETK